MSTQSISGYASKITPKVVVPSADLLVVTPGAFTVPPTLHYVLGQFIPGKPAASGSPASGLPGLESYKPEVPPTPAAPPEIVPVKQGVVTMTREQWENWTTQPEEEYLPKCVAELLDVQINR